MKTVKLCLWKARARAEPIPPRLRPVIRTVFLGIEVVMLSWRWAGER